MREGRSFPFSPIIVLFLCPANPRKSNGIMLVNPLDLFYLSALTVPKKAVSNMCSSTVFTRPFSSPRFNSRGGKGQSVSVRWNSSVPSYLYI